MDFKIILEITIEIISGFLGLLFIMRVLGKTQLSQITPFYFISALVLGEIVGNAIYDADVHLPLIIYTLILWAVLIYIVEIVTQKFSWSRSLFEGEPSIIIRNGKIDYNQLKKDRLDITEMMSMLRGRDVFSIQEVQYGILEPNGSLSIMRKSKIESDNELPIVLIFDKEINEKHLQLCNLTVKWLYDELAKQGIGSVDQVIYAEYTVSGGLYVNLFD